MYTIGLDVHKVDTQACILGEDGDVKDLRFQTERGRLGEIFGSMERSRILTVHDLFGGEARPASPAPQEISYVYHDEVRNSLFRVVRGAVRDGKKIFWQQRPDGSGGWTNGTARVRKVLFLLPEVTEADPSETVLIVEGETDVLTGVELGFVATTSPGGAGKWTEESEAEHHFGDVLRGRHVVIIPDNDYAG